MNKFSVQIKQAVTDEWYTSEKCVEMIIPFLRRGGYKKILCPFDKANSNFVKVLKENGFDVDYSHIEDGTNFFDISIDKLREYDAIVSNPPFSKRQMILERLFEAEVPFAMILNFNGLFDAKSRWELFKNNKFELIIPKGRMCFFNDTGFGNSPNFQSVYVCNGMSDKQIEFSDFDIK